jgi:hypothetical protein
MARAMDGGEAAPVGNLSRLSDGNGVSLPAAAAGEAFGSAVVVTGLRRNPLILIA